MAKELLMRELSHHKIWLSDWGSNCPNIVMLFGSDVYGKILIGQVRKWVVCGKVEDFLEKNGNALVLCNLAVRDFNVSDLWHLETIWIAYPRSSFTKSAKEELTQEHFLSSLSKGDNGRYCEGLPWMENNFELSSNHHAPEKRFFNLTKRLKFFNKYEDNDTIFKEWLQEVLLTLCRIKS